VLALGCTVSRPRLSLLAPRPSCRSGSSQQQASSTLALRRPRQPHARLSQPIDHLQTLKEPDLDLISLS
jgi:hypothetical protein